MSNDTEKFTQNTSELKTLKAENKRLQQELRRKDNALAGYRVRSSDIKNLYKNPSKQQSLNLASIVQR